jgi:3-dehydroquinate dehydratase/shikimate dehydrogenase
VDHGAIAVDLEIESAENATDQLERLRKTSKLVLSYHNFEGTPSIEPVYKRMAKIPAYAYKIVTTARKPSDAYKMLALAKAHPKEKLIVLAMGEPGFSSRVLAPSFGGLYTYAAPNAAEGTASGQVSAKMLRHLYRVDKFTKAAKIFGVVADPVRHSISPNVHNRAFQSKRMDAVYLPFLVHGNQLKDFFVMADAMPLSGASITIPHKQKILRYLDTVEPLARRIGAVNTIWKKAGKWRGTNTDAEGVTVPLAKRLKLAKSTALIVGNGGAARGAAFALADAGRRSRWWAGTWTGCGRWRGSAMANRCRANRRWRRPLTWWCIARRWGCGRIRTSASLKTGCRANWCSTWCTTRGRRCC